MTKSQYLQRLLIFSELPFFDLKKEGIEGDEYLQSPNFYVFPTQVLLPCFDWCGDTLSIVNPNQCGLSGSGHVTKDISFISHNQIILSANIMIII